MKTAIGTKTLQGKLIETQKDPNKMTKLFVEFDKNRKCNSKYFTDLINLFVNFQENTDTINTDLNAQDLEFLLNYFQKEEIESISKLNLVGDIINLPNSNEKIRILEQGNGVDCGICNAINIGQFFGGNIPDKHYDPDINKLKMSYRSRFYTQVRQERGENINNYWLNQLDGMAILKEILPSNITVDYPSGGEFHPKIEEVLVVNGKNRKITKSIYSEKMENARENKQWGVVNKFLLGANFDGTFLEKYIDKYVGFVFRYQENHWNSIVQKDGNWYKIDSLYDPKIEILSESNVYNFLQNHEVHICLKKK